MANIIFYVADSSGNGKPGLSLSFTTYKNQNGVNLSQPIISDIGGGFYSFVPIFSGNDTGILWIVKTAYNPTLIYEYVRHEDLGIGNLPLSPVKVFFPLFHSDSTIATGQSPAFAVYADQSGNALTHPAISDVGGGWYSFIPSFSLASGIVYSILESTLLPQITYQYITPNDFVFNGISAPVTNVSAQLKTTTNTSPTFGFDIAYDIDGNDLLVSDSLVSGNRLVAERISRMLTTPYGALASIDPDPNAAVWGWDCRQYINAKLSTAEIQAARTSIQNAVLQDEVVSNCIVDFSLNPINSTVLIALEVTTADGPFNLVLNIDQVSANIIFNSGQVS